MLDAFFIGATGMVGQQQNVDTIANNLANANTPAYKKTRVSFSELVIRPTATDLDQRAEMQALSVGALRGARRTASGWTGSGARVVTGAPSASVGRTGVGVGITALERMFDMGVLGKTGSAMDLAIEGDGFLEVVLPDGSNAYVRGGALKVDQDGLLATQSGLVLKPGLHVPSDTLALQISSDGRVSARLPDLAAPQEIGRLGLVRFINAQGLLAVGGNQYRSTDASGEPIAIRPGEDGAATLAQGYLENSNVSMVDEMVGLMVAQRAYGASVRLVQAADEMMGLINSLRR